MTTIKVTLTDEEVDFLKKLAKYDTKNFKHKETFKTEAQQLLCLQIRETQECLGDEIDEN